MKFKGGKEEAAKMLQGLDTLARQRVLDKIAENDAKLAQELAEKLISFEDLKYLTAQMRPVFLGGINLAELGLALRGGSLELREKILSQLSRNNREEVEEILKGKPQSVNKVQEAQDHILQFVRGEIDKGRIVLNPQGADKLV